MSEIELIPEHGMKITDLVNSIVALGVKYGDAHKRVREMIDRGEIELVEGFYVRRNAAQLLQG